MSKHKCSRNDIGWTNEIKWLEGSMEGHAKAPCRCTVCGKEYYELFSRTYSIYDIKTNERILRGL